MGTQRELWPRASVGWGQQLRMRSQELLKDLLPGFAFEQLAGKIHFYRFVQLAGGGGRSYTAKASRFFGQKRRPSNVRWEKVFEAD